MKLNSTFEKIGRQFQIEFSELSRETDHKQTAGEARERALMELLRRHLPKRVGIDRGFVIDALGQESKQIDIVIYDQTVATVFEASGVKYFPCETVLAVGEVKSDVVSTVTLGDALDKIRSVKALDRSNRGTNKPITGPGLSTEQIVRFDPASRHRDQILGFIFTDMSLSRESLVGGLQSWLLAHPRNVWPNIFCAFGSLLATYETPRALSPSAMDAATLAVTDVSEKGNLLLIFFCMLATFLQEVHVARPNYFDYGGVSTTQVMSHPLVGQ